MKLLYACLFLYFAVTTGAMAKAGYSVKVTADTNKALVGGRIYLRLEVRAESSYMAILPEFADTTGKIELLRKGPVKKEMENGRTAYRREFVITSFEPGIYYLPDFAFQFKRAARDTSVIVYARVPAVEFSTVEVDLEKDIKDIKGPLDIAKDWAGIILYLLIFTAAAGGGYYLWRRLRKKEKLPQKEERYDPKIPPHILALGQLKKLNADKLWQNGQYKKYYSELTAIIRIYIERRFDINALEMTSEEIMSLLTSSIATKDLAEKLDFILTTADLAKFAKEEPFPEDNTRCMNFCIEFIEQTKEDEAGGGK